MVSSDSVMAQFQPPLFNCTECNKSYYTQSNLSRHIKSEHKNERPECVTCHKTFANYGSLRVHERGSHPILYVEKATQVIMSSVRGNTATCLECPGSSFSFEKYGDYVSHAQKHLDHDTSKRITARPYQVPLVNSIL